MERTVQFYSEGIPVVGILGIPDDYKAGEKRAAVIFCQGFTGVKEMFLPHNAERLRAEVAGSALSQLRRDRDGSTISQTGARRRTPAMALLRPLETRPPLKFLEIPERHPPMGRRGTRSVRRPATTQRPCREWPLDRMP